MIKTQNEYRNKSNRSVDERHFCPVTKVFYYSAKYLFGSKAFINIFPISINQYRRMKETKNIFGDTDLTNTKIGTTYHNESIS